MKFIWSYLKKYTAAVILVVIIKFLGTLVELLIPYVLEHLIDNVAPTKNLQMVFFWGLIMVCLAVLVRYLNVTANRRAVQIASNTTYTIRRDLFFHSLHLSGNQLDEVGLPSLISRMTSDSYNVQNFIRAAQAMGIRAPVLLIGGMAITLTMDTGLATILCVIAPLVIICIVTISRLGIPLYENVQKKLDKVVRVMRENITGIHVVKALSKEEYEMERFGNANNELTAHEQKAGIIMALPGPIMAFFLNIGLTAVVIVGANRVNSGVTEPGVILAFLTYFNMILMGAMGINRIFMLMSKADASANRIASVIEKPTDLEVIPLESVPSSSDDSYIRFENVSFHYGKDSTHQQAVDISHIRQASLENIDFSIAKGGSLGIIGATGSGKTTIINLLMRYYDPTDGQVFINGRNVRTYKLDDLRRKFGVVFQNDVLFADTLEENIVFGRDISKEMLEQAIRDARAADFISETENSLSHIAAIRGSDFSGGQRQRLLIARALAGNSDILILDDSSSALDYKTDAALRKAIREHHRASATIIIAQRISSIMNLDNIIVLDEGKIIGYGTHKDLLNSCPSYQEIYHIQMGDEN